MSELARKALLDAKTVARAQTEERRRERWLIWNAKAQEERAALIADELLGLDVQNRRRLLAESVAIANGSDHANAMVRAARYLFDAEVVGCEEPGAAGRDLVGGGVGLREGRRTVPAGAADEAGAEAGAAAGCGGRVLPPVRQLDRAAEGGDGAGVVPGAVGRQAVMGRDAGAVAIGAPAERRGVQVADLRGIPGLRPVRGQGWETTEPDHRWCFRCFYSGDWGDWPVCPSCHQPSWVGRGCPSLGECTRSRRCAGGCRR